MRERVVTSGVGYWVSMESGLEDRNNRLTAFVQFITDLLVSMESGLEDRNNLVLRRRPR